MAKKGKDFESLVYEIYQIISISNSYNSVEMDVNLEGPDGPRQIDVLIRSKIAGMPILTIIECKDHSRNLDVTFVDALVSKMADVNANKGVLVARKGFSNGALKKARRLGITMCVADNASDKLRKIGFDLPVIGHHVEPTDKISVGFEFAEGQTHESIRFDANSLFNDMGLLEILRISLERGLYNFETSTIQLKDIFGKDDAWIRDPGSRKIFLLDVSIQMEIIEKFYFGYISDLAIAKYIVDITSGVNNVVINLSEFIPYREKLEEFSNRKDIPKFAQNTVIQIFGVPDRIEHIGKMTLYGRKK